MKINYCHICDKETEVGFHIGNGFICEKCVKEIQQKYTDKK